MGLREEPAIRRPSAAPRALLVLGWALSLGLLLSIPAVVGADPVDDLKRVQSALAKEKPGRALKRLERLRGGPLADHVALLRARVLRDEERLEEALEAAREGLAHDPPSELAAALSQEVTRIHLARGDLLAAYQSQRSAWESSQSTDRSAELAGELAAAYERAALPGDALQLYRRIWDRWPRASMANQAYRRSRQLELGTGARPPSGHELVQYADRRRASQHCEESLEIYARALSKDGLEPKTRRRAEFGRADCLFDIRRYDDAVQAYGRLVEQEPESMRARIDLARSHARRGDKERAVRQLDSIAGKAGPRTRARAKYLAALLAGTPESAERRKRLREVEDQRASPGYARLARWRLAWRDFQRGEDSAAALRLQSLAKGDPLDIEVQRARYWLAVIELGRERPEQGRALLRGLVEALPLSYYGFLAADRLGEPTKMDRSFLPTREGEEPERSVVRAGWLKEAGFEELARLELESRARAPKLDLALRLQLARLLHSVGDHYRAVRVLVDGVGDGLERGVDPAWSELWKLAWPRPYRAPVQRAREEFGAEEALVYAVMREESHYRADALSRVGARGLMQIMPPTGERIARSLGVEDFEARRLFQPETNIRFGSYYLRKLLRRFEGEQTLAIAAYNAGPEVVSGWAENHRPVLHDVFVDSVPYAETRRYLRRVLRSRRVYELLYGEQRPVSMPPQP